jgi:hypothetical protein
MDRPINRTQARSYIRAVNFYKSLWPRRAHVLVQLADLTGNKPFTWNETKQQAFNEMKAILAFDYINAYPDYNKPFHIYSDASDHQLGAAILQDGRSITYFSKKLTPTQKIIQRLKKNYSQ